jgi:signal transduction histidine kinase/DNA-binding response OmpR family regulator/HPt (histidine-containing phosphotransfer) domain-containing protein
MKLKRSDSVSFYIFSVCALSLMVIIFGIIIYLITAHEMKRQLGNRALGVASTAAAILEEKPAEYRAFIKTLDTSSDYYIKTKRLLEKIRFENPDNIAFLTMEVKFSENEVMYPLIGEREGTPTYSPPGTVEPITPIRKRAYDTQSAVIGDFVTTKWGTLLSAYVPVFDNRNGEFIGLAGTDISKDQYDAIMQKFLATIIVSIAITIIMGYIIIRQGIAKIITDRKSESKSAFLSNISHEIRTPLNAVLGLLEVEIQKDLPEKTKKNLRKIHDSGSLLLEIINDILDISKIESGNFEIISSEYDLSSLISDTVQLNIVRIGSKHITFCLEIDETAPARLIGDELRLKQILNNLLSNAIKYTEEGSITLSVTWRQNETGFLSFTITDTGRGIRKENMEKLFNAYTQFEVAANRNTQGTGLGLSITKGLVENMGGTITAESEYGRGSIFRVQIPQHAVGETIIGRETAKNLCNFQFSDSRREHDGNFVRHRMPYGKVLVVDDFEINLDVMTGILMPYCLQVDTVLSGKEAIEMIRAEEPRYDLIFMDHMMPEMDGIETGRVIREIDSDYARNVPMIALTANAIAGNREMFLENGFNDFISKPVDIKRLDAVLNRWIRDKQSEETLKSAEILIQSENDAPESEKTGAEKADMESWFMERPIEGIDFKASLAVFGKEAFIPVLKSFTVHTPAQLLEMADNLQNSLPDYAIRVHGLKGACNNICAKEVAALAFELEKAAKAGNIDFVRANHGKLETTLNTMLENLNAVLAEWDAMTPVQEKEKRQEPDRELLTRLKEAVEFFNSTQIDEIVNELEKYRYEIGEELIQQLRQQADNFDYDAMLESLRGGPLRSFNEK